VATFDSYIADIALNILKSQPGRYKDDKKTISVKEVLSMSSFDEVITRLAESEVEDCMRGSHTDQIAFIEAIASVDIRGHYERWPEFIEIFERRNLVAHQKSRVNNIYLSNCAGAKLDVSSIKVGQELILNSSYLKSSVNILLEFGILLLFVIWTKKFKSDTSITYQRFNEVSYNLIRSKNTIVASRLLNFALFKQSRNGSEDAIVKMMLINLANCYKKLGDEPKLKETLASTDWTSAADKFKVSIAALNNDVKTVVSLMPKLTDNEDVGLDGFRTWPVFDSIKGDAEYKSAFETVFGQALTTSDIKDDAAIGSTDTSAGEGTENMNDTLH
jgi:hypothetical protein